ncbi:MAG: RsmG family class I SAM-dependent methyltransferase [Marmoricola sp.]
MRLGGVCERPELAERYAELLVDQATVRGLIGPREVPRIWERHLLNCAVVTDLIPTGSTVADIGSGAGLPGICMAILSAGLGDHPDEAALRRTKFDEVVAELGLVNVCVHRSRAEELHGKRFFDVVTSRAVAPLGRLAQWSWPLCGPNGEVIAMKVPRQRKRLIGDAKDLERLGAVAEVELSVPSKAGISRGPGAAVTVVRIEESQEVDQISSWLGFT